MIYFVSDAHLGSRLDKDPLSREKILVNWLEFVRKDAEKIFLLGDIFDFWFEYKTVVPKGYVRILGKLAELADAGIEIHFFIGNHDIWAFDYFEKEVGMIVHHHAEIMELNGRRFFMAHGDGLESKEKGFNFIRKIFHSKLSQILFGYFPPRLGQEFGYEWSKANRLRILKTENGYRGENDEEIITFAKNYQSEPPIDFFVFGHRHLDIKLQIRNKAQVIILGDFVSLFSYGVFDGEEFRLEYFN
jgi:UDP-2,3-diacylglucosamine hydrolase